jgi:hypothetical protein
LGLLFLLALEILKVYFIMPFPGSQRSDSISIAYFLHRNTWWLRIAGIVFTVGPLIHFITKGKPWQKILLILAVLAYGFIFYMFNFRLLADKMFYQPKQKIFVSAAADTTKKDKLVIGVAINNEAKAYPIEIIGYHHQVQDTIHGQPIIVTYCTVCRTGRVFSPLVNGKHEQFRLVGMDHFNAMFEDATTKSWWQQATGTAIAGDLKGKQLTEIPSAQMRLGDWLAIYPDTKILQPDSNYLNRYADLKGFDAGTINGKLEHRDSLSGQDNSWVVGVSIRGKAKAYDWNELVTGKIINDSLAGIPLLITIEPNGKTFYVMNREFDQQVLQFVPTASKNLMEDSQTHSSWNLNGFCISGPLQGRQLQLLQAYQEFWHSCKHFHPNTTIYKK